MEVVTLDGGFSTQLAVHVGDTIDGDPLWSARYLSVAPESVRQTHLDFLYGKYVCLVLYV
jgi:homocysteine S-methyltransferase